MRRYFAGALLFVLVGQSTDASFATTASASRGASATSAGTDRMASLVAIARPNPPAPLVRHTPVPRRPLPDYRNPKRYAKLTPKLHGIVKEERLARPVDLTKLQRASSIEQRGSLQRPLRAKPIEMKVGAQGRARGLSLQPSVTGILPWWTYQTRSIPGIGAAMVNVANLNFLLAATDVNIPVGGVDLAFQRTYNSESLHDKNNDDGSGPSVYGNRWTNNLDVHLGWSLSGGSTGTVSIYTADGARDDYTCNVTSNSLCTPPTGVYDLLAPTQFTGSGGVACQFQWTLKSGVSYIFNAPYQGCSFGQGSYGRLQTIDGRNTTFYLQLAYSWSGGDDSNPENLTKITVTHQPDGAQLALSFGQIANTSVTELMSITRPDGETINYHYSNNGDLDGVDVPGNNPMLSYGVAMPTQFADGSPIAQGNVPQIYDVESPGLLEVCGPRAAITILDGNTGSSTKADGACVDFDYNNHQLTDWYTRGVLNPIPDDDVISAAIQSSPSPGDFVQWDDTTFFNDVLNNNCSSGIMAELSDAYGHGSEWCYDSSSRVTQVWGQVSTNDWLKTSQGWDTNNDLVSTTDARGNETDIAYDSEGNVVEVSLPSQTTSQGAVRPTYLIDHDGYNNITNFCDPANNASNAWNPSPGPTPCSGGGSTSYTKLRYNYLAGNEIYGCLNASYTPGNYHRSVSYADGVCGTGLPTQIVGDTYSEADGTQRAPTQAFVYGPAGNLKQFNPGDPDNSIWQIKYTSDGMNRVQSVADPDGVTSYRCYNFDGTVFYSETAKQHQLDNNPTSCTTTPPPYAVAYGYDADGDVATALQHHDCPDSNGVCAAGSPPPSPGPKKCYSVAVPAGTTCDFYDGLDRLVEVRLPYDSNADMYARPWTMRYLYDLTGGTYQFYGSNAFSAYGNLFETEELLPQNPTVSVTAPPTAAPGSIDNSYYQPVKAIASDGLNRPITKYSANGTASPPYWTESLTWDTSPIGGGNVAGLLGQDCNSASQCQQFDYEPDGELKTFESSDGSSPERDYSYDPDGRATKIIFSGYNLPQTYSYNADGSLSSSTDAAGTAQDQATLTHHRYPDGLEKMVDVSSTPFSQTGLFTYSYRNDGPLQTEVINDGTLGSIQNNGQTTLSYAYTDAGRLASRTESGAAALPSPATTITYDGTGLVQHEVTPVATLSNFSYTAENELTAVKSSNANNTYCGTQTYYYTYTLRGELRDGCPGALPFFANGVSLRAPFAGGLIGQQTWNDLMAVNIGVRSLLKSCNDQSDYCTSSWSYDSTGRMNSEVGPYPVSTATASPPPAYNTTTVRTYDAENHLLTTQFQNGSPNSYENEAVHWGPDGHPIKIGTYFGTNSGNEVDERLHWNGDQLLFTTHVKNGQSKVDDVKIDVQGDILVGDQGYSGLTFYDRDPSGTIMGCHNASPGTSYGGLDDGWATKAYSPCTSNQSGSMPTSGVWGANPYTYSFNQGSGGGVGNGSTLTLPRTDGINDGFDTIQGVRSYDNAQGSWTTPDADAGELDDPATQRAYLWNANNPMNSVDPTGFNSSIYVPRAPEWGSDPNWAQWDNYLAMLTNPAVINPRNLRTIAIVTAHCRCKPPPPRPNPLTNNGTLDPTNFFFMVSLFSWVLPDGGGEIMAGGRMLRYIPKIGRQMLKRGWTAALIKDAVESPSSTFAAVDMTTSPPSAATGYYNSTTGQYVVVNNQTGQIIQVGGPGFRPPMAP